jgi:nicotinamidase-related amidase
MSRTIDLRCQYYDMTPIGRQRGHVTEELTLQLSETALFLVDVYGLGYSEGEPVPEREPLWFPGSFEIVRGIMRDAIAPCLEASRAAAMPIVYVTNSNPAVRSDRSEFGAVLRRTHGLSDRERWGAESPEEFAFSRCVAPREGEPVCKKLFYSGFHGTYTDVLLRNLGIKTLVAVGFATNACLQATLTEAMYRSYRVILLRDCTAGMECDDTYRDMRLTGSFIRFIETHVGFTSSAGELTAALGEAAGRGIRP